MQAKLSPLSSFSVQGRHTVHICYVLKNKCKVSLVRVRLSELFWAHNDFPQYIPWNEFRCVVSETGTKSRDKNSHPVVSVVCNCLSLPLMPASNELWGASLKRITNCCYRTSPKLCTRLALCRSLLHYNAVIMGAMASQITSLAIVYSTVYSGADQRKHQSSASLVFVWGVHRGREFTGDRWIPRAKGQ